MRSSRQAATSAPSPSRICARGRRPVAGRTGSCHAEGKEDRGDLRRSRFPHAGNQCLSTINRPISGYPFVSDALVTKRNFLHLRCFISTTISANRALTGLTNAPGPVADRAGLNPILFRYDESLGGSSKRQFGRVGFARGRTTG